MKITKTYCDRCGKEFDYPVKRKIWLSGVSREGGFDLCDNCYNGLVYWFNYKEGEEHESNHN